MASSALKPCAIGKPQSHARFGRFFDGCHGPSSDDPHSVPSLDPEWAAIGEQLAKCVPGAIGKSKLAGNSRTFSELVAGQHAAFAIFSPGVVKLALFRVGLVIGEPID